MNLQPVDPDLFRQTHNGSRWYIDPLNSDDQWETSHDRYPSVSHVKRASATDWSNIALRRVANAIDTLTPRLDELPFDTRYTLMRTINTNGLKNAGQRGTNVHEIVDAALNGRLDLINTNSPGANYRQAITEFFEKYTPTPVATEFVVINRTLNASGYGGTCDALIEIAGKRYIVDWKSRGEASDHGAYRMEAAQLAAYANADYMIVGGATGPVRQPLPPIDGGLIVSIKSDSVAVYPVDLQHAHRYWVALHTWHCDQDNTPNPIGTVWASNKNVVATTQAPHGTRPDVVATTTKPLRRPRTPAINPTQGMTVNTDDKELLRIQYRNLTAPRKAWVKTLIDESTRCDLTFNLGLQPTMRSYEIMRGVLHLAALPNDNTDQHSDDTGLYLTELTRATLSIQLGEPAFNGNLAALLGNLDIDSAWTFATNAADVVR